MSPYIDFNVDVVTQNLIEQDADGCIVGYYDKRIPTFRSPKGVTIVMATIADTASQSREKRHVHELIDNGFENIAVGNHRSEWMSGQRDTFERYADMADNMGYRWFAPITHRTICEDLFRKPERQLRTSMIERNIPGICFSGNVLCGYLFGDIRVPHQGFDDKGKAETSLTGRNIHGEYGLTIDALRNWLDGLNVITGCGGQLGIDAGMYRYAQHVGFAGILSWPPFDLSRTPSEIHDPPEQLPLMCGVENTGYAVTV